MLAGLLCVLPAQARAELNVFACEPEWAALAGEIGGGMVDVYSATTFMQDPHHVQARPSLIAKTRQADLLVCTGAGLEAGWLPLLLRKAGNAAIQPGRPGHLLAAEHVALLEKPDTLDRSLGDIHAQGNPHVHTDPNNLLAVAAVLHRRLLELDPGNADAYSSAYDRFRQKWQAAMQRWDGMRTSLAGKKIVVHHNYWSYLIAWTGMEKTATLEPVPGVAPSSSQLVQVRKRMAEGVALIINTSYVNERSTRWLSTQTGIPVVTLNATVNHQQGETLEQWFDSVLKAVTEPGHES